MPHTKVRAAQTKRGKKEASAIKKMREKGMSYRKIGEIHHRSPSFAHHVCNGKESCKESIGNERKLVVDAVFHLRKQYPKKKIIGYKLISKKLKWSLSKTRKRLAVYGEIPGMALKNRRKVENEPLSDEELRRYERSRSYFGY